MHMRVSISLPFVTSVGRGLCGRFQTSKCRVPASCCGWEVFTMGQRLQLQSQLEELLGSRNVYFQPPTNVQMQYPCIVYNRDSANSQYADDIPYRFTKRYQVTAIDQDPDSTIADK